MGNALIELLEPALEAVKNGDRFFWATVVNNDPIRVQEDTATMPLGIQPTSLTNVKIGDRVFCLRYGRRLVILGRKPKDTGTGVETFKLEKKSSHLGDSSRGVVKNGRVLLHVTYTGDFHVTGWQSFPLGKVPDKYRPKGFSYVTIPPYSDAAGGSFAAWVDKDGNVYIVASSSVKHPYGSYQFEIVYDIDI